MSDWQKGYAAGKQDALESGECRFECKKMNARIEKEAFVAGYKAASRTDWEALHAESAYKEWKDAK